MLKRNQQDLAPLGRRNRVVPGLLEFAEENPVEAGLLAASMAPVPVVSDVAGLLGDITGMVKRPEDRTWANAVLAALGLLPFVPAGITKITKSVDLPDLRKMDVAEGTAVARKEPHLIPSHDKADGKYVGGPRMVKSKRGLTNLRNRFDAYVAADPRGGDWYDRYRNSVTDVTGGDPRDAEWMSKMEAQWSAGVSPEGELGFALKENNAALAGSPTKSARPAQHEAFKRAIDANDPNELQLGKKTGEYGRRIDPSQPHPPTATGVNDFRHARNFDYTEVGGGSQRDALTDAQHRFLDYETALAVNRANHANIGGRSDWTGEQLQAAPWVRQKAEAILEQRPAILEKYRKLGLPEQDAYRLAYEEAFTEATKTIGEHFPKHTAYATHESMVGPNTGHMPGSVNATQAEREAFAVDPRSTWANAPGGRDAIYSGRRLDDTGVAMRVRPTQPMQGLYQPPGGLLEVNPGEVARPLVAFDSGKVKSLPQTDRDILEAGEAVRAYVDAQDAGAAHKVWAGGASGQSNSMFVPRSGPATQEQLMAVRDAAAPYGLGDVVDTGEGLTVTSFYPDPPKMSSKQAGLLTDALDGALPGEAVVPRRVKVDSVYEDYVDAWKAGEGSGKATEQLLRKINKSPELRAAFDNNPHLAENALNRLQRDKDWSSKWGGTREDIQTARSVIAGGPGWVGRLEKLVKKGVLPAALVGAVLSNARLSGEEQS